jgi:magnesium-transporting ATPase (P-type)
MKTPKKKKNHKLRSRVYRAIGLSSIGLTTTTGFLVYQSLIDWQNFASEIEQFFIVSQETVKLNLVIAFPILISFVVFLFIMLRKNREFFKDKVSLSLLLAIAGLYLVYSVLEIVLASLIGAFVGAIADEFIFLPLANANKEKYLEEKDINIEYDKEKRRILARTQAREELDGSV